MRNIVLCSIIAVAMALGGSASPQSRVDSTAEAGREVSATILIAKGDSYLENAVARILVDSLQRKGADVKVVDVKSIWSDDPRQHQVVVVFNGVPSGKFDAALRDLTRGSRDVNSSILISTVYGAPWDTSGPSMNGVTAATKTLRPLDVANKLLKFINQAIAGDSTR